jgi:glycosyltransferase involved in cell wall biosynthesis
MRILYATDNFPPPFSGHALAVINMAAKMSTRGHETAIVAPSADKFKDSTSFLGELDHIAVSETGNIAVHFQRSLPFIHGDNVIKSLFIKVKRIENILTDFKPNIVHYNGWGPLCKKTYKAQKRMGTGATIATCHGVPMHVTNAFLRRNPITMKLEKYIWRMMVQFYGQMGFVLSPSAFVHRQLIAAGLPEQKGEPLSNGIATEQYMRIDHRLRDETRSRYGLPVHKVLLTYIGRLDPEKNVHVLTGAIRRLSDNKSVHFVVAGAGKLRKKLETMKKEGRDNLSLFNWLEHNELIDILGVSDVFFIPSPSESQSITTLEAMASSLPVIACNEGALPDLVQDGVNGFLFWSDQIDLCMEKLAILAADSRLRETFGKASRKRAVQHDMKKVMTTLENRYQRLTN